MHSAYVLLYFLYFWKIVAYLETWQIVFKEWSSFFLAFRLFLPFLEIRLAKI